MAVPYLFLDLGSSQFKALAVSPEKDFWRILLPAIRQSRGIRQGEVRDVESAADELESLLKEMEGFLKNVHFKQAIVNINSPELNISSSKGTTVTTRPDGEITEDDKERADKASQALPLAANRTLVQSVIKNYLIDNSIKVKDPVGLKGLRLEAESLLIDVFEPVLRNLDQVGDLVDLKFVSKYVLPYAGAEVALTPQDKEVGAILIDLGATTTGFCVYQNNELMDLKVFPVGGENITHDITIGLKTSIETAENIKIKEGNALCKKLNKNDTFNLSAYWGEATEGQKISKRFLAEIIEARLEEMFDLIEARLKEKGYLGKLPGGVVLIGGGAKMTLIKDFVKEKLNLPTRIGEAVSIDWYKDNPDPVLIPVLGLMALKRQEELSGSDHSNLFPKFSNWLTKFFSRK